MRVVLQRVKKARVTVEGATAGQIGAGYLLLLGAEEEDTVQTADRMIDKICRLRIFPDANGKTNLSLADVGGEILVVSQFTLYADCKKGNRPSFAKAARIWRGPCMSTLWTDAGCTRTRWNRGCSAPVWRWSWSTTVRSR